MSERDDELGRRLAAAFDAQARADVPDDRTPPPLCLTDDLATRRHRTHVAGGRVRWVAPLAAAAAVLLTVAIAGGLSDRSGHRQGQAGKPALSAPAASAPRSTGVPTASAQGSQPAGAARVHVTSAVISDGTRVGVGMPIIVLLSRPIRDARAFAAATTVRVNGAPVHGAWYFERRYATPGKPIEADYRLPQYWPAHARIQLDLPVRDVSAGTGLVFDNNLSLDFTTGAANVVTVDNATHTLTVNSDGKRWGIFPVSLGAQNTPTLRGTKVVMEKGASICMSGPGYSECGIRYTQRLTYSGEYLHAAPWNVANIVHGVNSSNGCTNLLMPDARKLYQLLRVGDVVRYPNASGAQMQLGDGYGDWNVPWSQWLTGGLYRTS